jgi:hypothetical protein
MDCEVVVSDETEALLSILGRIGSPPPGTSVVDSKQVADNSVLL